MDRLDSIKALVTAFRKERDWEQFHNPKNLAISLSLEASELLEHFQWKNMEESLEYVSKHKEELSDEIADILVYLLYMSSDFGIDLVGAVENKMKKNKAKYPIDKSKGNSKKYTELN